MNQLILGDTQNVLAVLEPKSIDLAYIDLPSDIIDPAEVNSNNKTAKQYRKWLNTTVKNTFPLLKDTASIFINIPSSLKTWAVDKAFSKYFGKENYKGEIKWMPTQNESKLSVNTSLLHTTILYYSVSDLYACNYPYNEHYLQKIYQYRDHKGSYRLDSLESSHADGFFYKYKGHEAPATGWAFPVESLEEWDALDLLNIPEDRGEPITFKKYYVNQKNTGNSLCKVSPFNSPQKGFTYHSKNPANLLRRIIQYASNEGDTLLSVNLRNRRILQQADQYKRYWIGIDASLKNIKSAEYQLNKANSHDFSLRIYQHEPRTRLYSEAEKFETWITEYFQPQLMNDASVIIKLNNNLGLSAIDSIVKAHIHPLRKQRLNNADNQDLFHGVLVGSSFSQHAIEEAKRLYTYENIRLKLVAIDDLIPVPQAPEIQYTIDTPNNNGQEEQEVTFNLQVNNNQSIAFYSWDFDYQPDKIFRPQIMLQQDPNLTHSFAPGRYTVAVQATQKDGLSSIQTLEIEVKSSMEEKIAS